MIETLTDGEEAQLGLLVRAVHDLCVGLGIPPAFPSLLVEALVRTALSRAKPNRRAAYLDQWRHYLCWFPDAMTRIPANQRSSFATKALREFRLQDWRGKGKVGTGIPAGANTLAARDGELWFAQVPEQARKPKPVTLEPPPRDQWRRFQAGHAVHTEDAPASPVDLAEAKWLRPFNQPRVLRKEYQRLHQRLKGYKDRRRGLSEESIWKTEFPDVPVAVVRRWFVGRDPTSSDLALLVAAYRVGLAPSRGRLSRLREMVAWAK